MDEEFTYSGEWWIPGKRERKVLGILIFSLSKGLVLELFDYLVDDHFSQINFFPLVCGSTESGEQFTLEKCYSVDMTEYREDKIVRKLRANRGYGGVHFQNNNAIQFSSIYIRFQCLDNWFQILPLHLDINSSIEDINKSYQKRDPLSVEVKNGDITFLTDGPLISPGDIPKSIKISEESWIKNIKEPTLSL